MRITRGRLIVTVSFLYVVTAVVVLTSFRSLTVIEQKELIVRVHQPEDVEDKRNNDGQPRNAVLQRKIGSMVSQETAFLTDSKSSTNSDNLNVSIPVKVDANFDGGQLFYCDVSDTSSYNYTGNESSDDLDRVNFIRISQTADIYILGEAYLDLRPGYRSPAIRLIVIVGHSTNASCFTTSIQNCAVDAQDDTIGVTPARKKRKLKTEMVTARMQSRSDLNIFAYEFNENHNKPLRGYIITFELNASRIRLDTFPTQITLAHSAHAGARVDIPVRKMMPAAFRLADTKEFQVSSNNETDPSRNSGPRPNGNAPVTANEDNVLIPRYDSWHTQFSRPYQHTFAVCVPPLFGIVEPERLIEFIEMHRILGVTRFVFYISNLRNADEIRSLLSTYKQSDEISQHKKHRSRKRKEVTVEILRWNMPFDDAHIWYHGQLPAIHHCLYENVGISKYTAFIDIDEVIMPRSGPTWHEMLAEIDVIRLGKQARPAGFRFRGAFFDTNKLGLPNEDLYRAKLFYSPTSTETSTVSVSPNGGPRWPPTPAAPAFDDPSQMRLALITNELINELEKSANYTFTAEAIELLNRFGELRFGKLVERNDPPTRVRTKCIVKPDFVFEMGIHHVSKQHVEEMEPYDVAEQHGLLNHYRTCEAAFDVSCGFFIPDVTLVSRHKRQLYIQIAEKLVSLANGPGNFKWSDHKAGEN